MHILISKELVNIKVGNEATPSCRTLSDEDGKVDGDPQIIISNSHCKACPSYIKKPLV